MSGCVKRREGGKIKKDYLHLGLGGGGEGEGQCQFYYVHFCKTLRAHKVSYFASNVRPNVIRLGKIGA